VTAARQALPPVEVRRLTGLVEYEEATRMQLAALARMKADEAEREHLFLLEHPPTITLGRSADARNVLADVEVLGRLGVKLVQTSRGGDVTYHGPGQLVGYALMRLAKRGRDIHRYLRNLEKVLIRALADFGIQAGRIDGLTGVWVGKRKVASIGVAVSKWITYHGFALNVAPDMQHFKLINPCGLRAHEMTSMAALMGGWCETADVAAAVGRQFAKVFDVGGEIAE